MQLRIYLSLYWIFFHSRRVTHSGSKLPDDHVDIILSFFQACNRAVHDMKLPVSKVALIRALSNLMLQGATPTILRAPSVWSLPRQVKSRLESLSYCALVLMGWSYRSWPWFFARPRLKHDFEFLAHQAF